MASALGSIYAAPPMAAPEKRMLPPTSAAATLAAAPAAALTLATEGDSSGTVTLDLSSGSDPMSEIRRIQERGLGADEVGPEMPSKNTLELLLTKCIHGIPTRAPDPSHAPCVTCLCLSSPLRCARSNPVLAGSRRLKRR